MAQAVAQFFSIIGPDITPPATMQELIPYLVTIAVGVFLASAVFRIVAAIVSELVGMRRM
jgi:hypothetical protein